MFKLFYYLVLLGCVCQTWATQKAQFHNYKVFSLDIETAEQVDVLLSLEKINSGYEFWQEPHVGRRAELMVPPNKFGDFAELIKLLNINSTVKVENVQELIDNERPKSRIGQSRIPVDWTNYNTYEEIYDWLDEQLLRYPEILTSFSIGTSYQGRPIRGVRLSYKSGNPTIFIESTIHAREWITSATTTWLLNELLTSNDTAVQALAENIDWYILPIFNIDGFAYTHSTNRLWRKTRQNHATICYGADANRNFDINWMGEGASDNVCLETYGGPFPFSEPETEALVNYVRSIPKVNIYLSFHSYGQYLLFPYGFNEHTPNHDDLLTIGLATSAAIAQRYNTDYLVGTSYETLYAVAGSSRDYMYGAVGIPVVYSFEFRDRRGGPYGFVLPADQIVPNSEEILDGILALVDTSRTLGYLIP